MEQPLSEYDCDAWRTRLDTLMHDATLATTLRWEQEIRALATIDRLRAVNAKLLEALGFYADKGNWELELASYGAPNCVAYGDAGKQARVAIKEARK